MNLLGIDFGTTKTLAARWDERTKSPSTIRLARNGDAIPTTIHVSKAGKMIFGEDADDERAIDYAGWKGRIKRDLGRGTTVVLHGESYKVVDLVARFLEHVRLRVENEAFHGTVDHVVVTVPALYGPAQRDELKQAIKQAGFKSYELLEEPVAAGCAFLLEKADTELGRHVLVFDWGGGTLDLALVEHRDGQFHPKPEWISGNENLGGEDIDESVVENVDAAHSAAVGAVDSQPDDRRMQIRRNLKDGKHLLSRREEHTFRLPYESGLQEFAWRRDQFEHVAAATIDQAFGCLRDHLHKIRNSGLHVKHVLLVGGSSQIPAVSRRISSELDLKPIPWNNSQTAVALGAAIRSASFAEFANPNPGKKQSPGECVPTIDVGVYKGNCTNLSLGDPLKAELKLMIYRSTGASFIGDLILTGDLEGGSRLEGNLSFPEIMFETRSSNNSFSLEWKGTLAGNRIVGTYRSKDTNWAMHMLGLDKQQGVWECVKVEEPLGIDKAEQFPTPASNSGFSNDKLSLLLRPSGYGKLYRILSKELLESNVFSINENTAECYWELVMTNKTKEPLKKVKIVISNPSSGETQADIPCIEELTKEECLDFQLFWHFTLGNLIEVSWVQRNSHGKLVYEVNSTDCLASRGQQLPIICTWKSGLFSGKVLNLRNLGEAKIDNLVVKTNTGSFNLRTIDPGAEIAVGWAEFSDSRNLKDDERIELLAPGYLTDVGIITP